MFAGGSRLKALRVPIMDHAPLRVLARDQDVSLEWRQPRWGQYYYRLESPRGLLAVLQTVGAFRLATTLATADGSYRFETRWNRATKMFFEGEAEPRISFSPGFWSGGKLVLRNGEVLRWKSNGVCRHAIETEDGLPLVVFDGSHEWFKNCALLTMHDAIWRRDDVTELLGLGFALLAVLDRRTAD